MKKKNTKQVRGSRPDVFLEKRCSENKQQIYLWTESWIPEHFRSTSYI